MKVDRETLERWRRERLAQRERERDLRELDAISVTVHLRDLAPRLRTST